MVGGLLNRIPAFTVFNDVGASPWLNFAAVVGKTRGSLWYILLCHPLIRTASIHAHIDIDGRLDHLHRSGLGVLTEVKNDFLLYPLNPHQAESRLLPFPRSRAYVKFILSGSVPDIGVKPGPSPSTRLQARSFLVVLCAKLVIGATRYAPKPNPAPVFDTRRNI